VFCPGVDISDISDKIDMARLALKLGIFRNISPFQRTNKGISRWTFPLPKNPDEHPSPIVLSEYRYYFSEKTAINIDRYWAIKISRITLCTALIPSATEGIPRAPRHSATQRRRQQRATQASMTELMVRPPRPQRIKNNVDQLGLGKRVEVQWRSPENGRMQFFKAGLAVSLLYCICIFVFVLYLYLCLLYCICISVLVLYGFYSTYSTSFFCKGVPLRNVMWKG
jgi:hypothetical protein